MKRVPSILALLVITAGLAGCRATAVRLAADAVTGSGSTYATDEDPQLVRDAVPFGLKTMEGLLAEDPHNAKLLAALASNFTQYTYAFIQFDADQADLDGKLDAARAGRERARRLFLRAREYGLRALDERHRGVSNGLAAGRDLGPVLKKLEKRDVELLYWTAAPWALAISDGKGDMALVAELPVPVAMMERALALDESWGEGALHEFFITLDATRSASEGGGPERARTHLERALQLSMNKKLGPRVAYAEGVLVRQQDRAAFERELRAVLAANAEEVPKYRLVNILAQQRARMLLDHVDDLFAD